MNRFALPLVLIMAMITGGVAKAATAPSMSAGDLQGMCLSSYDVEYGWCAGYVTALAEAGGGACQDAPVRSQQYVDIFKAYMEVFPEAKKSPAPQAVSAAMARAFPCR